MAITLKRDIPHQRVVDHYLNVFRRWNEEYVPCQILIDRFLDRNTVWHLVILDRNDFLNLETPSGWDSTITPQQHKLLKEVIYTGVTGGDPEYSVTARTDVSKKLALLENGELLGELIIRTTHEPSDRQDASYYIEDGFGKSVAIKQFLENGNDYEIRAYCQIRLI